MCAHACAHMICVPLEISSHTAVHCPPLSVSGYSCRVFVCYILMLNVSFSYTSREGVTINFSVASHCHLKRGNTSHRHDDDLESFVWKTRSDASLKNGKVHFFPPGSLVE